MLVLLNKDENVFTSKLLRHITTFKTKSIEHYSNFFFLAEYREGGTVEGGISRRPENIPALIKSANGCRSTVTPSELKD
jgi:hypothetical protein